MNEIFSLKNLRVALYVAIFMVASLLFFRWELIVAQEQQKQITLAQAQAGSDIPNLGLNNQNNGIAAPTSMRTTPMAQPIVSGNLITVDTPLYTLSIDLHGGDIVAAYLKNYKQTLNNAAPFQLLGTDAANLFYVVQSGLVTNDTSIPAKIDFVSAQRSYVLNNDKSLSVNLTWESPRGVSIVKAYTFSPDAYTVSVNYVLKNASRAPLSVRFYGQLSRTAPNVPAAFFNSYTNYTGAAISYPDDHYQKLSFARIAQGNLNQTVTSGWVAMLQHYFITAWVPMGNQSITQFSSVNNGVYAVGLANAGISIAAGQSASTGATLYMGPAIASQLGQIAPYLDKAVDYGWLWFISELIFEAMQWLHSLVGNWGIAIILVTVLIKLLFYPLSAKSFRSMARMRELQPKITALREKFGDDKQKLGMATMELYRKEKVNPVSGCLPMLVQIPVFIALYWVIMESVEFRQAPFFGWIHDLSVHDPYFILPVLMGISMFVQQKLSPQVPDPMMAKMMMILPIVFTIMFLNFPAGLVLYWVVNNCLTILQQQWVIRQTLRQDRANKKINKR